MAINTFMKANPSPRLAGQMVLAVMFYLIGGLAPLMAQAVPAPSAAPFPGVNPSATPIPVFNAPAAPSAPKLPGTPPTVSAKQETIQLPLRKLIALEDPIMLRGASSIYTVFVPQSSRLRFKSVTLNLDYTNSIALLGDRSILRVVVNDVIVAQYRLDRDHPTNSVEIGIPVSTLKNGFNRLQFIVAQHYTMKCEDPGAPELFTEINPDTSYLSAAVEWREIPLRLSYLRWWVDERLWNPYQFNVCLPGATQISDEQLHWGAVVTQGVALALNYQPFRVATAPALRAGMDNIVVGTMNELSGFLNATEIGQINGSFLAIKALPGDPTHCMVIISGRDEQEVGQTAHAFGLVNFPLPDAQYAVMDQVSLPTAPAFIRNAPVQTPGIYSFKQLGYQTKSIKGWNTGGYTLQVYMPGDISKEDASNTELRLHFTYGGAFRKDSVLNVFVNGQFQKALRLDDARGAMHSDHRVYIPMLAFQPGRNAVEITPRMVPLWTNECELLQVENLVFTLYDDSEFVLPRAMRKARLPSLGLFSQTAYPYSGPPDGSETAVLVTARDGETVSAAWTLMGKMAQISGALLHRTEMTFKPTRSKKSLLVIGARDQVPEDIMEKAPVSPLPVGKMRYLVSTSPKPEKLAASPIEEIIEKVRGVPTERAEPEAPSTASMNMAADMISDTVAVQFESPFNVGYPVTLVTANDPALLLAGINALQDRQIWDNLAGDLAVWNSDPASLEVAKVGPDFIYKATSVTTRVATNLDRQPVLFAAILIGVLLVIGLGVAAILRKRDKHKDTDSVL